MQGERNHPYGVRRIDPLGRESEAGMTLGFSLFLIAVGAILRFAVTETVAGIDIQVVGVILMIVGAMGFVVTLVMFFSRRGGPGARPPQY